MSESVNLEEMSEEERRSYYLNKKGYRINKPTFARHLIMRRLKKRYSKEGYFKGITDNQMCKIVDRIMELKVKRLKYDGYLNLGFGLGMIILKPEEKSMPEFHNVTVNFKKTLDYWAKNIEAYKKKVVIRDYSASKTMKWHWTKRRSKDNLKYYVFKPQKKLERQIFHDYLKGDVVIINK